MTTEEAGLLNWLKELRKAMYGELDLTKPVQTYDGDPVTITRADGPDAEYPIEGVIHWRAQVPGGFEEGERATLWAANGDCCSRRHCDTLVNASEPAESERADR